MRKMLRNQYLQKKPLVFKTERDMGRSSIKVYQFLIVSRKKPNFGCVWWYRTSDRGDEQWPKPKNSLC